MSASQGPDSHKLAILRRLIAEADADVAAARCYAIPDVQTLLALIKNEPDTVR